MEKHIKWLFFPFVLVAVLPLFWGITALAIILASIVFSFYSAKYGLSFSVVGLLFFFIIATLLRGTQTTLLISLYCVPAFLMGTLLFKKARFSTLLISSTGATLFVLVLHSKAVSKALGAEPAQWLFHDSIEEMRRMLVSSAPLDTSMATEMEIMLRQASNIMQTMLPCFYILFAAFLMFLLFNIVRFLLDKVNMHLEGMPHFYELWLPKSMSVIFVILFLFVLFTNSPVLMNVVFVMFTIHVVCGLSMIDFYLVRHKTPKVLRIVILGIILTFSTVFGGLTSTILCCMGMNDGMRAVRK